VPKRRILLILFPVAAVAIVGLVMVLTREREPEYGGKKLSEWMEQLGSKSSGSPEEEMAEEAIRHIGTNALPVLLKRIRYEASDWKTELYERFNSALVKVNPNWTVSDKKELRADQAVMAFYALRPGAEAAIPELTQLLNQPQLVAGPTRAIAILVSLGKPGLPPLLLALTNDVRRMTTVRLLIVAGLRNGGTNARPASAALVNLLVDRDRNVREATTNALRKIDPAALDKAKAR
jgi:HEAT repeat protein